MTEPFNFEATSDGRVRIFRGGRLVTTLAGRDASRFLSRAEFADDSSQQRLMARATGQYRFGNERNATAARRKKGRRN